MIRAARADERDLIQSQLRTSWGSATIVSRGRSRDASRLPAFLATHDEDVVGLATFELSGPECELVTLNAFRAGQGIGSALLDRVTETAAEHGCLRVWLVTTNDNLAALGFYQRRGMRLVAVHPGAVDEARRVKPTIPLVGDQGIPIHDELELEIRLD